jgi:hypothetical protein
LSDHCAEVERLVMFTLQPAKDTPPLAEAVTARTARGQALRTTTQVSRFLGLHLQSIAATTGTCNYETERSNLTESDKHMRTTTTSKDDDEASLSTAGPDADADTCSATTAAEDSLDGTAAGPSP